ncbi:MAG: amidoligase family protein [Halieaceae bacterium]|nr:amidoligase family protein [Halieaceae bacterium]
MTASDGRYVRPPRLQTASGATRCVGFELEFAGLEFKEAVQVLARVFDHSADYASLAKASVPHPDWGTFVVEVDSELAKQLADTRASSRKDGSVEDDPLAEWLVNLTTELVPVEVVCPPVPMDALAGLDPMVRALRHAGAEGTAESVVYAFGLHINPELPALDPATIGQYLRAYVVAQDWLVRRHRVDMSRRFTPYIDLYPSGYRRRVLGYDDELTLDDLLADYFSYNATRNRALDMLPLFKHLDEERVVEAVPDSRINARPTFHYRLPNCEIERGDWLLAESWNLWCVIEQLANDPGTLDELCSQCRRYESQLVNFTRAPWHKTLDRILDDLVSA